jgi:hypothetical protein
MAAKPSSKKQNADARKKQEQRKERYERRRRKNNSLISLGYGIVAAALAFFVLLNTANGNFSAYGYFVGLVFAVFAVGLLLPESVKDRFMEAWNHKRGKD